MCSPMGHFPRFSFFSPYSRTYSVHFSLSQFLSFSLYIPGQTVFVSKFVRFSGFFVAIFQVLHGAFLIFHFFRCFLPYSTSYRLFVSFSTFFSILAIIQVLPCIFHIFSRFPLFLAIFLFLQCVFLIFHDYQFSPHTPGPTVCISHFPRFQCF